MKETNEHSGSELKKGHIISSRYVVQSCLGSGGMGAVYLAEDRVLEGSHVAVKVLRSDVVHDESQTKRFLREVQLMHRLNHPNVVRTYDVGKDGPLLYFTMEVVKGRPLEDLLEREVVFSVSQIVDILRQTCEGLMAIHAADIVHRDLKPANLMLLEDDTLKITDFGIARPKSSQLTQHNEIIGSVSYIAPEVWLGKDIVPATDLYSLGVIAYELTTGVLPFDGDEPATMMWMHVKRPPKPPKSLRPDIPNWLNQFILKLLAKDPGERPNNAGDVSRYLTEKLRRLRERDGGSQTGAMSSSSGGSGDFPLVHSASGAWPSARSSGSGSYTRRATGGRSSSGSMTRTSRRFVRRQIRENGGFLIAGIAFLSAIGFLIYRAANYLNALLLL